MLFAITETNSLVITDSNINQKIDFCIYFLHVLVQLKSLIKFILTQFTDALFLQLLKDFFQLNSTRLDLFQ